MNDASISPVIIALTEMYTQTILKVLEHPRRGIIGTFHFVSPQNLQRYCDEFAHRYNTRTATTPERFLAAVKGAQGKRLKCRELTPN